MKNAVLAAGCLVALGMISTVGEAYSQGAVACQCRANGSDYAIDSVVCIKLPSGSYLARCEMVLNNTAWKRLGDSCPLSQSKPTQSLKIKTSG